MAVAHGSVSRRWKKKRTTALREHYIYILQAHKAYGNDTRGIEMKESKTPFVCVVSLPALNGRFQGRITCYGNDVREK